MKKRILSLVLISLLILSSFSFALGVDTNQDEIKTITIIHTNDTHARVLDADGILGFARISTIIKEKKAENPNTLVLDAGDTLHGMPIINISKGENAVKILDAAGYDFMVPGNHDFNYGQERLLELKDMANFSMLSANVLDENEKNLFESYQIVEMNGVKVGIFGLSTPETAYKTSPDNVKGITFADPIEVSKKMVEELQDKTDVIIALAHIGIDESSVVTSKKIAESVDGIDVIIDGHSHTTLESGILVNDTLIAQTGNYDNNLGFVNIQVKDGLIIDKQAELLSYEEAKETALDPELSAFIDNIKEENETIFAQVVAKTDIDLDGARENVRTKETNLGNLSADAVRAASGADIGFVNGGNIRVSIPVGDITFGKVAELFPFGNTVQVKKIIGEDLIKVLEVSVSGYPATQGGFLQVSGLTFSFDPTQPAGSRVAEVLISGKALDKDSEYTVAINDFLGIGGDGYEVFKSYPIYAEFGTYEEIFANYLNTNGTKGIDVSGRITVVEEPQTVEPQPAETVDEPAVEVKEPETVDEPVVEVKVPETVMNETSYTVVSGDVLWKIAVKYNTTWEALAKYNNLSNPHLIFPGQIIKIPATEAKPAA